MANEAPEHDGTLQGSEKTPRELHLFWDQPCATGIVHSVPSSALWPDNLACNLSCIISYHSSYSFQAAICLVLLILSTFCCWIEGMERWGGSPGKHSYYSCKYDICLLSSPHFSVLVFLTMSKLYRRWRCLWGAWWRLLIVAFSDYN